MLSMPKEIKKVLILDDNKDTLAVFSGYLNQLTDQNLEILPAQNLDEAKQIIEEPQTRIDLFVVDIHLSGLGQLDFEGLRFTDLIRSKTDYTKAPILAVSADNSDNTLQQAFNHGASRFIRKPCTLEAFSLVTRELLSV